MEVRRATAAELVARFEQDVENHEQYLEDFHAKKYRPKGPRDAAVAKMAKSIPLSPQQQELNFQKFVFGLTKITRRYGVALQCIGGVYIADEVGEYKNLDYNADSSSGDLLPVW